VTPTPGTRFPIALGSDAHFRTVREFLEDCGYTPAAAAERMGLQSLDHLGRFELCDTMQRERNLALPDPLGAVVRLFLAGQILDPAGVARIPAQVWDAFEALGLAQRGNFAADGSCYSPVMLYPVAGNFIVSDRFVKPQGGAADSAPDFVFLPLQRTGTDFLRFIPDSPCETFLDLGTGTGVAALYAARNFAGHAWGIDIADRSVHFAEFGRRLNGIANVTFLKGDLYQPCEGRQFDRIVIHPPYALAATSGYIYADGGDDGEFLTRRALQGAHQHLAPGGIFFCWTTALDLKGAPLEQRVRGMLGEQQSECDVAVLVEEPSDPETFAIATVAARSEPPSQLAVWRTRIRDMNVEQFIYGGILVRRHRAAEARPFTVRRRTSAQTSRQAQEWLLQWEAAAAQPSISTVLLDSRPRPRAEAELHVRHSFRDGALTPAEYRLRATYPFDAALSAPAWLAFLFSKCDGSRTGAELFELVRPSLPAGKEPVHFLIGLSALISGGFVELDAFPIPERSGLPGGAR
jgi:SAM-dependent methyltransferase